MLQTIIISIISGLLNKDFWFSYILFLIIIGGILVLFIYITRVASNEKFKFSKKLIILNLILILISLVLIFTDNYFSILNLFRKEIITQDYLSINLSISKYINMPRILIIIILIIYLLLTLIMVVKITYSKYGPLRTNL